MHEPPVRSFEILGIRVLDQIIFGERKCFSFADDDLFGDNLV